MITHQIIEQSLNYSIDSSNVKTHQDENDNKKKHEQYLYREQSQIIKNSVKYSKQQKNKNRKNRICQFKLKSQTIKQLQIFNPYIDIAHKEYFYWEQYFTFNYFKDTTTLQCKDNQLEIYCQNHHINLSQLYFLLDSKLLTNIFYSIKSLNGNLVQANVTQQQHEYDNNQQICIQQLSTNFNYIFSNECISQISNHTPNILIINNLPEYVQSEEDQWSFIQENQKEIVPSNSKTINNQDQGQKINFIEAWSIVKTLKIEKEMHQTNKNNQKKVSVLDKFFGFNSSQQILKNNFMNEKYQLFYFAQVPFCEKEIFHFRILKSIYQRLTGVDICPRYGPHWELIGFQGRDPAKDLRGVGMLGLLQMLAYQQKHPEIVKYIYKHSQDQVKYFPFAACLLNVTKIVLETLQQGSLDKMITQQRSAINVANNLYFSIFFHLFVIYIRGDFNIMDINRLLQRVSVYSLTNSEKCIKKFALTIDKINKFGIEDVIHDKIGEYNNNSQINIINVNLTFLSSIITN